MYECVHVYLAATAATWGNEQICCRAYCNRVQHTASHCNILQHTATYCNTLSHGRLVVVYAAIDCNRLQQTEADCRLVVVHTATHSNTVNSIRE